VRRPLVLLLGPSRDAISGVSTHLNMLLPADALLREFELAHFQVGSEGRAEGAAGRLARLLASPLRLALAIARSGAQVVHVNTSLNPRAYWRDLLYVATAKLCGAKVVYQVHGGELPAEFFRSRALAAFLRWTLGWPDAVVVLAQVEHDAYRAFVPRQKVALVPNGIDCLPYLRQQRPPPDPGTPLRLGFVGRLARAKGLYEIVEAVARLRGRGIPVRLFLAGSGPEEGWLRNRVRELDLKREVTFLGPLDGERKARLLGLVDAFVLPSYGEGLPYALLEAMAAGAVPIVTPVGAMPDVVAEGVHGFLVRQGDPEAIAAAAAALAADRPRLARMSAACRLRVAEAFSVARVVEDLRALYSTLASPHVRNRRLDRRSAQRA
jgi:glycosyltransferase involved in cell wall biosynthesis